MRLKKYNGLVEIGYRTTIWPSVKFAVGSSIPGSPAKITIGAGCSIGDRTEIHCCRSVSIGNGVLIAWEVNILENNYHTNLEGTIKSKPIRIEDAVWIGCRAIILSGVTIGKGSIVGAGSVVTKDVPAGSLVAGNPARFVRTTGPWR